MQIYCSAMNYPKAPVYGRDTWQLKHDDIIAVLAAPSNAAAAPTIDWWVYDWRLVGDTTTRAAGRVRRAAKTLLAPPANILFDLQVSGDGSTVLQLTRNAA